MTTHDEAMEAARRIVREVAELPDRTSPEDQPEMMLVTDHELSDIVANVLNDTLADARALLAVPSPSPDVGEMNRGVAAGAAPRTSTAEMPTVPKTFDQKHMRDWKMTQNACAAGEALVGVRAIHRDGCTIVISCDSDLEALKRTDEICAALSLSQDEESAIVSFETVEEANAAGVFSGMLADGDTFGDEDDGPEGGHSEFIGMEDSAFLKALTPSAETKAAYIGEFKFRSASGRVTYTVPWTTIKEIMAAIHAFASKDASGEKAGVTQAAEGSTRPPPSDIREALEKIEWAIPLLPECQRAIQACRDARAALTSSPPGDGKLQRQETLKDALAAIGGADSVGEAEHRIIDLIEKEET